MASSVERDIGIRNEGKRMMLIRLQKQKEAQQKALHILHQTLDGAVSEQFVSENAHFIDPPLYDDMVEERHLAKLCGYLICGNKLEKVPKQKYHISARTNRVYDISKRKKFCSNYCYKASCFLQQQLLTSPLYLRDEETPVCIKLLPVEGNLGSASETIITKEQSQVALELRNTEINDQRRRGMVVNITRKTSEQKFAENEKSEGKTEPNNSSNVVEMSSEKTMSNKQELTENKKSEGKTEPKVLDLKDSKMKDVSYNVWTDPMKVEHDSEKELRILEEDSLENMKIDTSRLQISSGTPEESETKNSEMKVVGEKTESEMKNETKGLLVNEQGLASNTNACVKGKSYGSVGIDEIFKPLQKDLDSDDDDDGGVDGDEEKHGGFGCHGNQDGTQKEKVNYLMKLLDKRETMIMRSQRTEDSFKNDARKGNDHSFTHGALSEDGEAGKDSKKNENKVRRADTQDKGIIHPVEIDNAKSENTQSATEVAPSSNSHSQTGGKDTGTTNIDFFDQIEKTILEWTTESTVEYLLGSKEVKLRIKEKQQFDEKYAELGRKVHLNQLDLDSVGMYQTADPEGAGRGFRGLPDMKMLQKDVEDFGLKVKEYYKGNTSFSQAVEVKEEHFGGNKNQSEVTSNKIEEDPILPMVDHYSQQLIRKKIVFDRLSKVLPDLLGPLNLPVHEVSADFRSMIGTFSLSSHNIVFRSTEWIVLAILLLKMLGVHNRRIGRTLELPNAERFLKLVLAPFGEGFDKRIEGTLRKVTHQPS